MALLRPTLGLLLIALLTPTSGLAILGGAPVKDRQIESRVKLLDTRVQSESVVCTATAIGPRQLLTAAHCFQHLADKNCVLSDRRFITSTEQTPKFCKVSLQINRKAQEAFQIHRHPRYQKNSSLPTYLNRTNYDVAVVTFQDVLFPHYFAVDSGAKKKNQDILFYGYGMSRIQGLEMNNQPHFLESQRGKLKQLKLTQAQYLNGLIRIPSAPLTLDASTKNYTLQGPGQILRSDSGGPILAGNRIIAIARNYTISGFSAEASSPQIEAQRKDSETLSMESTFTDIRSKEIQQFLKSLRP